MLDKLKTVLFFPVAGYFKFFARIRLNIWNPQIIVVTGSSGKTTLLHLIESEIGDKAKYSHHANSAIGVPFDILGLSRKTLMPSEWIALFIAAPFKAFQKQFSQKIYVVEADADRPNEAKFLANLLKPDVTLWANVGRTHSLNFQTSVPRQFKTIDEAIAYEFGNFLENTKSLVIINFDSELITNQLTRTKAETGNIKIKDLENYKLGKDFTEFTIKNKAYKFNYLLPKDVFYSIQAALLLFDYLKIKPNQLFSRFHMPPGRSSIFQGIKNTTLIDSTYNANLGSMVALINLFKAYPANDKWVVLGDMLEQGRFEKEEHEKLAEVILSLNPAKIILVGKLVSLYTYPKLKEKIADTNRIQAFTSLKNTLTYLLENIKDGETILFKSSQSIMLDAVVEQLLQNKDDADKLCRREKYWIARKERLGL